MIRLPTRPGRRAQTRRGDGAIEREPLTPQYGNSDDERACRRYGKHPAWQFEDEDGDLEASPAAPPQGVEAHDSSCTPPPQSQQRKEQRERPPDAEEIDTPSRFRTSGSASCQHAEPSGSVVSTRRAFGHRSSARRLGFALGTLSGSRLGASPSVEPGRPMAAFALAARGPNQKANASRRPKRADKRSASRAC